MFCVEDNKEYCEVLMGFVVVCCVDGRRVYCNHSIIEDRGGSVWSFITCNMALVTVCCGVLK